MIARMAISATEPGRIVSADAEHSVATYGHVLVLCWRGGVSVASLQAVRKAHFELLQKYPDGIGCLTISEITRVGDLPVTEATQLIRATYKNVRWSACVVHGEGFMASASRAALTSLLTLSGQVALVRAFRELPAALAWQEAHDSGLGIASLQLDRVAREALAAMR